MGWEGRVWVGVGEVMGGDGRGGCGWVWGRDGRGWEGWEVMGGMGGCEGVSKNGAREKEKIVPRDAGSNFTLYVY